ncbi:MAG: hypothetical protein ACR2QE_00240 [Acidimicrobiales bacterium]
MTDPAPPPDAATGHDDAHRRLVAVVVVLATLLVVVAVTAVLLDPGDQGAVASTPTTTFDLDAEHRSVAADFLGAWQQWRTTDVVLTGAFSRERPDGERLESETVIAQVGDQRIVSRLGGAEGYDGTDKIRCVNESNGEVRCDRTPTGESAEERLAAELDQWATYLSGSPPYYRAGRSDAVAGLDCFELVLTRANPTADFGTVALFCFAVDGPLLHTRIDYANGLVETTDITTVQTEAIDPAVFDRLEGEPAGR